MTDTNVPWEAHPGWYPVDSENVGYWDGAKWSGQVHPKPQAPKGPGFPSVNAAATPPGTVGTSSGASRPKVPWYRRNWVVAVAALVVGITLGVVSAAAAADPTESPEYQALSQDLREVRGQLQAAEADLSSARAEVEQIAGDLPAREEAVKTAQAALDDREDALDNRDAAVRAAEKAVATREEKVGLIETEIANNTIPGDGVYEVGVDMKAGTYKTSGAADCYYGVNADANGNTIKSNNITDGPAMVSVSDGEFFEASGCADFVLQQ